MTVLINSTLSPRYADVYTPRFSFLTHERADLVPESGLLTKEPFSNKRLEGKDGINCKTSQQAAPLVLFVS